MAKSFKQKRYLGLFIFFFVIGTIWGRFFYYDEAKRAKFFSDQPVVLLAPKNFVPPQLLSKFTEDTSKQVTVIEYVDIKDLIEKLWDQPIDLIAFSSTDADDVIDLLSPFEKQKIKNLKLISIDFKNLPYDEKNELAIPLFWGVRKKHNIDKSRLWIESIGITQASKNKTDAYIFIDYLLEPDTAIEAVKIKKVASTNSSLESSASIQSKWKPSYLRKISIRNLSFVERAGF